ncbi:MAG TPA: aminotransferase class V-fold PLP-dependent enzyme [Bryobacteraceae bacterium]|nr:aminotransferase class V-fold PLP-dependent enzyme [Bryobacteraceae bacterium]
MTDWKKIRSEFPALENWTFLNTATFGQLPRRATEAVAGHFARRDRYACADFMKWFDDADGIRASIARLIHVAADDIAFIPNASTGLSLLMGGIDWNPGDRVVTLEHEFPNHYYYPSVLGARGVEFVETSFERFHEAVTPRTRLVAISMLNYSTGFRPPLAEVAQFLRDHGTLLYVDGTQGLGALELDVGAIRPAMLSVDGYKWMLAPTGGGFMYIDPALREHLRPNIIGWRSHRGWREHENLHHGAPEFGTKAEKYEGGMLAFGAIYGMGASVEMMLEIGPPVIERRVMQLAALTRDVLRRAGGRLAADCDPHYDSPVVTARFEGKDARQLARALEARKVLVAARHGNLRVSPHFYNDESDLGRFETELRQVLD